MTDHYTKETAVKRYDQIDALKGIAIFLVVLGHSIIVHPINLHDNAICDFIFRWLSSVHMPLFFLVSGFCFSFRDNYKEYLWKKVKRLVVPYIVFSALDILSRLLLPGLVNGTSNIKESLYKVLAYGGEYWFLYTLFLIFLIYPMIYRFVKGHIYKYVMIIAALLALYFFLPPISLLTLKSVIYYLIYFTVGVMLKEFVGNQIFKKNDNKVKVSVLALAVFAVWLGLVKIDAAELRIIAAVAGIVTFYFCIQYEPVVNLFKRFGKYSLQLYLFNGYLLVISRTIAVSVLGITNPVFIITFNMLIDFVLSYLVIKYICDRIKIVKVLIGML